MTRPGASAGPARARTAEERALLVLRTAAGPSGFVASRIGPPNYRRIWTRDGAVASLAAVAAVDAGVDDLVGAAIRTMDTIAAAIGPHGEIPSNVDESNGDVSFGAIVGRVDVPLWYAIAASAVARFDAAFARRHGPPIARALDLMASWEINGRGLVPVPLAGTWADEYVTSGYLLEVQALRLIALRTAILADGSPGPDPDRAALADRLRDRIELDYWSGHAHHPAKDHYHPVAYRAVAGRPYRYWLSSFDAAGYVTRFDALANILAVGLGLGTPAIRATVTAFVTGLSGGGLLPAFSPVIEPADLDWRLLRRNHRYSFRNRPGAYHNGGRWAWLTGLWVAALAAEDRDAAVSHADALDAANGLGPRGGSGGWAFAEFHNAATGRPGGVAGMTWSAAGTVIARRALAGTFSFPGRRLTTGVGL